MWIHCPASCGLGGRHPVDWVAGIPWIGWPTSVEYAYHRGHAFEDRIAAVLEALDYRVVLRRTLAAREIDIVATRIALPLPATYLIECKTGKVSAEEIDRFHAKIVAVQTKEQVHRRSIPILIHTGKIVGHALENAEAFGITCLEFADLFRGLWPYDRYLSILDERYERSRIDHYHVSLSGRSEEGESFSLDEHLMKWAGDQNRRSLVLLGDYGTGKTWSCLRLVKQLTDAFRSDPHAHPLPLLISFRRVRKETSAIDLVRYELSEEYGIDPPTPESLQRLLATDSVLLILDGMDEMAKVPGNRSALISYYNLGLPVHDAKVLITCRTHYFYSGSEEREVFPAKDDREELPSSFQFETVHILPLSRSTIRAYVGKRFFL